MSRKLDGKLRIYAAAATAASIAGISDASAQSLYTGSYSHVAGGNGSSLTDATGTTFMDIGDDTLKNSTNVHLYLTGLGDSANFLYTGTQSTGSVANLPVGTSIDSTGATLPGSMTPTGAYEGNPLTSDGTDNDIAYINAPTGTTYTPVSTDTPVQFNVGQVGYYAFNLVPPGSGTTDYGYASITFDVAGDVAGAYSFDTTGSAITVAPFPISAWFNPGSGDYSAAANWTAGVPGGVGFEADFGTFANQSGGTTVNIASPTVLSTVTFNNTVSSYTLSGSGSLTMNSSTGSALIENQLGVHTISVPVTFASSGSLNVSSGSATVTNTLTITQPVTFLQSGAINVGTYAGLNITAPLTVASGQSLAVTEQAYYGYTTGTIAFAAMNISSGASVSFSYPYAGGVGLFTASSLTLGANASAAVLAPNSTTDGKALLQVGGLSLTPTSRLDLQTNDLIVQNNASLSSVTSEIASAYNNGNWNGSAGITSSAAAADTNHVTALGVIENTSDGTNPIYGPNGQGTFASFDGVEPNPTDILVRFTYYGDANLDGQVDGSDYSLIDNGYLNSLSGWYNGDFNYDGVVNGSDYTLIDNAYNTQGANLLDTPSGPSAQITAEIAGGASSVPEPATLGILAMGAIGLLRRKR